MNASENKWNVTHIIEGILWDSVELELEFKCNLNQTWLIGYNKYQTFHLHETRQVYKCVACERRTFSIFFLHWNILHKPLVITDAFAMVHFSNWQFFVFKNLPEILCSINQNWGLIKWFRSRSLCFIPAVSQCVRGAHCCSVSHKGLEFDVDNEY